MRLDVDGLAVQAEVRWAAVLGCSGAAVGRVCRTLTPIEIKHIG